MSGQGQGQMANVSIDALVKAIEKRRTEQVTAHAKAVTQFEKDLVSWRTEAAKKLTEWVGRIKKGEMPHDRYGELQLGIKSAPTEPKDLDFVQMDRDLSSLRLMVDESIKLRTDSNFFRYL